MLAYILALSVGFGSLAIYMAAFFFPEIHRKNDFIWSGVGLFYALVLWVCAGRITGGLLLGQVAGVALFGWSLTQTMTLRRQLTPQKQQTQLPSALEVKNTVREKVSNLSLPQRLSQLQQRVTVTVTRVKDQVQQTLSKSTQKTKTPLSQSTQPPSTPPTAATGEAMPGVSSAIAQSENAVRPIAPQQNDENKPRVEIIDNRSFVPEQPGAIPATAQLTTDTVSATESVAEVIPPNSPVTDELVQAARESAAAQDAQTREDSPERNQEGSATELIRPNAPDPELVEAAIRDAEEKHQEASPPDTEQP